MTGADLAAEADRLVGVEPRRARQVAARAAIAAHAAGDAVAEAAAYRADALAALALGRQVEATQAIQRAVRIAERAGESAAAGEARVTLAVMLYRQGHTASALRQLDRAETQLDGLLVGRLLMQRGLILQECGRESEALAAYREAVPVLRAAGDISRLARLHNNRGNLHVLRGALASGYQDLTTAYRLYRELGLESMAADAVANLGFLSARRGDVPEALARYDAAEAVHRRLGKPNPELLLDRCEALLAVGLVDEARATAERAVLDLRAAGMSTLAADGMLLLAQATLADGDPAAARDAAHRAARTFARQRRPRWALLARSVALRADERRDVPPNALRTSALRLGAALDRAGWRVPALDARLVAARAALDLGATKTARRELRAAGAARRGGPLALRIRAWYAEALLRTADGNLAGAERALRAGLDAVDRERATLGATELRVHMAGHGGDLALLGVQLAEQSGSAGKVLAWTERWRAGALHMVPVRPPEDAELADNLAELRRVSAAAETALLDGRPTGPLFARKSALEQRVRRLARHSSGTQIVPTSGPPQIEELAAAVGDSVLIEFADFRGMLLAVTIRDGRLKLHRLGPTDAVIRAGESARFALRRLATGHGAGETARQALATAADRLDAALFGPLDLGDHSLVVIPPGSLHSLPWRVLPSAAGRPITVAPSAASWLRASRVPAPDPAGRVLLVAGPRLPAARQEVAALADLYPAARVLTGGAATAEATLRGLDGADIAHVAAHGRLRRDNALFSAFDCADGPITVYELERLRAAPALVVLSACQSGVAAVAAGDELMGSTAALFALGTRSIIATVVPVDDSATAPLMSALHAELRDGRSPAVALATVAEDTADPATAAGFVCYGAG
jgi:tetratricopeptide (TPR) repeat protein